MQSMLDVALALAAKGFAIFPADPETRAPMLQFTKEATTSEVVIRTWWAQRPAAMPAILLGPRNLVVDVDPRNGGKESFEAFLSEHPELVPTFRAVPRVETARGGWHFYFRVPEGVDVKNGEWIKGVDLKTQNAFVIAPGAVRSDGLRYGDMSAGDVLDVPAIIAGARARDAKPEREPTTAVVMSAGAELEEAMTPGLVALLAPNLANKGSRHDVARALGGALAVTGWTDEGIAELVGALPSDAPENRVRDALEAAARAREGKEAPQWGALERAGYAPAIVQAARTMADGGRLDTMAAGLVAQPGAELVQPAATEADPWGTFEIEDVTAPLAPIPWVCDAINFAPGAPTVLAGYGGVGKSMFAQAFAVCVATGRSFMTTKMVQRSGLVLHFDWEQGKRETRSRYQRLACQLFKNEKDISGMLRGKLKIMSPPPMYLNQQVAEDALKYKCNGATMALVDSLRAACPGVDENDSQMREPLDMLLRVSDATGCAFMVIHHARKTASSNRGGANENMRGTSAINDAAQNVIMCEAVNEDDDGGAFLVSNAKTRIGAKFPAFAVALRDTQLERPFLGLEFFIVDGAAVAAAKQKEVERSAESEVLAVITGSPGGVFAGGKAMLNVALRGKLSQDKIKNAVDALIYTQRIIETKDSTNKVRYQVRSL